jgi:hypothetical protein
VGLKLNGTHQILTYVDDVNLLGDNIDTINENAETMSLSCNQNAGSNHNINIGNILFENVAQFIYLRTTVTNQHLNQNEIKMRLNSCYHSVQNLLSFRLTIMYSYFTFYVIIRKKRSDAATLLNETTAYHQNEK